MYSLYTSGTGFYFIRDIVSNCESFKSLVEPKLFQSIRRSQARTCQSLSYAQFIDKLRPRTRVSFSQENERL